MLQESATAPVDVFAVLPDPGGASSVDDLVAGLRLLKVWDPPRFVALCHAELESDCLWGLPTSQFISNTKAIPYTAPENRASTDGLSKSLAPNGVIGSETVFLLIHRTNAHIPCSPRIRRLVIASLNLRKWSCTGAGRGP